MPVPTNLDNEGTRASQLYAASLATYTLAVIAVSCRFLCRRLLKSGYGFDDWFSIAALVSPSLRLIRLGLHEHSCQQRVSWLVHLCVSRSLNSIP